MESLIVSLNVVLPLVFLIGIGYCLKLKKIVSDKTLAEMNKVIFTLLLPCVLMKNVMDSDISKLMQPQLIVYCLGMITIFIVASFIYAMKFERVRAKRGVICQACFRSNFVLFGIPIVTTLFGENQIGITTILIAFVVPYMNVVSVFVLQYFADGCFKLKSTLISVLKNPMVIATFIGVFILVSGIELPTFLKSTINDISKTATPIALIVLGGTFKLPSLVHNLKQIIMIACTRLLIFPLIGIGGALLLGYRGIELISLLVVFGAPTAVASFSTAVEMKGDGELAGQAVLMTTMVSVITFFIWIFVFNQFGFIY